jgi:hypothetical protein
VGGGGAGDKAMAWSGLVEGGEGINIFSTPKRTVGSFFG